MHSCVTIVDENFGADIVLIGNFRGACLLHLQGSPRKVSCLGELHFSLQNLSYAGGGYPGAQPPTGGYPGVQQGGYPGSGYPGSQQPGSGYPGSRPGSGYPGQQQQMGGYPGPQPQQMGGYPGGQHQHMGGYPGGAVAPGVSPEVQQWFNAVDADRSGRITALELKSALISGQGKHFSDTACQLMIG